MNEQQIEATEPATEASAKASSTKPARREKGGKAGRRPSPVKKRAVKAKAGATKGKKTEKAASSKRGGTKQEQLIGMLKRPEGTTIDEVVKALGWQPHTIRGAISGALKKKLGLTVESQKVEGRGRVYRIAD